MHSNKQVGWPPNFEDFQEDVRKEDPGESTDGLSKENVPKLTEDQRNPIPPSDNELL